MIIDGRKIARRILARLRKKQPPKKTLAAIFVGNNFASQSFLNQKAKVARVLGVLFKIYKFNSSISAPGLESRIAKLNKDSNVGGIIIQLPLPKKFNREGIIKTIIRSKDVDALNSSSIIQPPTVGAVEEILKYLKFALKSKKTVVIGRGLLVGAPVASYLKSKVKSLVITDRDNLDLKSIKEADLIVSGVGKPKLIKGKHIKKGAVLIDFGYGFTRRGKKRIVVGDFDFPSSLRKARAITPTPGGTGPIVVLKLFQNFFILTNR